MKKIVASIFLMILTFIVLSSCKTKNDLNEYENLNQEYISVFQPIYTYSKFEKEIKNEKPVFVFLGKSNCQYCQLYLPLIAEYAYNNKINIIYYNIEYAKEEYYTINDSNEIIINENNDYAKLANLLFQYDSNVTLEGSNNNFVKLKKVENEETLPWIYVPRLIKFENGIPIKNCFTTQTDDSTDFEKYLQSDDLIKEFIEEMNQSTAECEELCPIV